MTFSNLEAGANTGMFTGDIAALEKALTAGYGTDVAQLTGGAALRIQSLDKTMQAVVAENKHFVLFNRLPKPKATATVDEWTEMNGVGGAPGATANSELGVIAAADGSYARRVGQVKYLMTRREVSFVQTLQNTIVDSKAQEYANGAIQLLQDVEHFLFEGDSAVVPTQFDGIGPLLEAGVASGDVDPGNVIDMAGAPLETADVITRAEAQISGNGNYGQATDVLFSPLVQADMDLGLAPQWRVSLNNAPNDLMTGAPVTGIRTSGGIISAARDVFIRDELQKRAWDVTYPAFAAANVAMKPQSIAAPAPGANAASAFAGAHAGTYFYGVAAISNRGQSAVTMSAQIAVAAGQAVVLTITGAAGGTETGYVIYRGRKNGPNAVTDLREMVRIPKGGATTVWTDLNKEIPGSTNAYILNMAPGATAITWRQLLPMVKFDLFPTDRAALPWAQMLFGYLRVSKRRHHVKVKNIITRGQAWKPF